MFNKISIPFIIFSLSLIVTAQSSPLQKAFNFYFEQKDYCNALENFEKAMQTQELANYPLYYAAQSACQCNKPETAFKYFIKSFEKTQDFYNYEFFANDKLNNCFSNTPEWKNVLAKMKSKHEAYSKASNDYQKAVNDSSLRLNYSDIGAAELRAKLKRMSPEKIIQEIKTGKYYQKPPKLDHWTLYSIKNGNGEEVPFLLYIPSDYIPSKSKPLVMYLHGGVGNRQKFSTNVFVPDFEKGGLKSLQDRNVFIIYPFAKKDFNWLSTQDCFDTLQKQIRFAKTLYNIDDNRVYVGGHSDGATGSFWFAINNRTDFAAFYGLAQKPMTFLGKPFLRNLANPQKLFSLNGEKDDLFEFGPIAEVYEKAKTISANWTLDSIKGAGHSFLNVFPQEVSDFYTRILNEKRNPLPTALFWQTDSENSKQNFWLKVTKLTGATPAVINARYASNTFTIEATGAKELQILIPYGLIDYKRDVEIYVNGQTLFKGRVKMDNNVMIESFITDRDREFVVTNAIDIVVEK